ncbi:MAG: hypothetical protein ACXVSF_09450 [Solirubrobacteraceae bacterium]
MREVPEPTIAGASEQAATLKPDTDAATPKAHVSEEPQLVRTVTARAHRQLQRATAAAAQHT